MRVCDSAIVSAVPCFHSLADTHPRSIGARRISDGIMGKGKKLPKTSTGTKKLIATTVAANQYYAIEQLNTL